MNQETALDLCFAVMHSNMHQSNTSKIFVFYDIYRQEDVKEEINHFKKTVYLQLKMYKLYFIICLI